MEYPGKLPPGIAEQIVAMHAAAEAAMPLPRSQRMKRYLDGLPLALEEQLLADRHVVRETPAWSDPRVIRLAMLTVGAYNLMIAEDLGNRAIGDPGEMMKGLHGIVGMLQLHMGERAGLLQLVEGPEHPWDWEHRVHYVSKLADLPARMVALGIWDAGSDQEHAFRTVPRPGAP